MENLIIALKTVFPLFSFMAIGYIVRLTKTIDDSTMLKMNGVLFKLFVPFMVFNTIYEVNLSTSFDIKMLLFTLCSVIIWGGALFFIIPRLCKNSDDRRIGAIIQVLARSNFIIFGIPIARSIYGDANVGTTAILVAITCPYFNAFGIFVLEYFKDRHANIKRILWNVIKAPAIIAVTLGGLCLILQIRLPEMCNEVIADVGDVTTPLALILLGGSFCFDDLKQNKRVLVVTTFAKLILLPLIFVIAAILFGIRGQELLAMITLFGGPVSIMAYITGAHMGSDGVFTGQMVTISAIFSVITIFLWVYGLKTLGFL